jgi:hypothetical protein
MDSSTAIPNHGSALSSHCGSCGEVHAPNAIICPACGALLAAYRSPPGVTGPISARASAPPPGGTPNAPPVSQPRTLSPIGDALRESHRVWLGLPPDDAAGPLISGPVVSAVLVAPDRTAQPQRPRPLRARDVPQMATLPPSRLGFGARLKRTPRPGSPDNIQDVVMSFAFAAVLVIGGGVAFSTPGAIGGLVIALAVLRLRARMLA